jgi:hypothetical protein
MQTIGRPGRGRRRPDAASDVDSGELDAPGDERRPGSLAEAVEDGGGAREVVVGDAPVLDASVVGDHGVGGAWVAVEGHADAAGVDELDPLGRPPAAEREVGVAEDQPAGVDPPEELVVLR